MGRGSGAADVRGRAPRGRRRLVARAAGIDPGDTARVCARAPGAAGGRRGRRAREGTLTMGVRAQMRVAAALGAAAAALVLAGCGGSGGTVPPAGGARRAV